MRVLLFNESRITKLILPEEVDGSFWLTDELDNELISIEAVGNKWLMKSNDDVKVLQNNTYVSEIDIVPNNFYYIDKNGKQYFIYSENSFDSTINYYNAIDKISVGIDNNSTVSYKIPYLYNNYITLTYNNNVWFLEKDKNAIVYINDYLLKGNGKTLNYGDSIFILGVRINVYKGVFSVNNPNNLVIINGVHVINFPVYESNSEFVPESVSIKEIDLYNEDDYFYKTPRVRRFIEEYDLKLTMPPGKASKDEMPGILVWGPRLTMAVVSITSFYRVLSGVLDGTKKLENTFPTLISSGAMLLTSIMWPTITRKYQQMKKKKMEKQRVTKYKAYLERKRKELNEVASTQSSIINENFIPLKACEQIILSKSRNLWERKVNQKDFLTFRVGVGAVPMQIKVHYNEEDFSMEVDKLKNMTIDLINEYKYLSNLPVSYSFYNKKVTAIMGNMDYYLKFIDNVLLQLMSFHSYDDLKIVFLVNKKNIAVWSKYKLLPHCFSDDKQIRFFADEDEEIKYICSYLTNEYINRANNNVGNNIVENEDSEKEKIIKPYYLIITDDYPSLRRIDLIDMILENKTNLGFGLVCLANKLNKLPSECEDYIVVDTNSTILSTNIDNYFQQNFIRDIDNTVDIEKCCGVLSNIPIEFTFNSRGLPTALGFLEMFNVGKVEQLNSHNRWRMNDPIKSLRTQIGINDEAKPIYLDLHEKFHGPHGLIAGTTGSGKSEFIITYILSLALNYSPNEVAFILIDYKGGGLAGAFQNKTLNLKLPHLAGTITNLDKASLNRTLVSINSELQRRQRKFNEERDKLGESTIDIYKYQKFFREGKITDPMPHLFIISDEFAELKAQQPEFMEDLISAARIGRSLGIHLILATQKPSGVVNGQIWSNSKFKVCLKVQDTSDSNEMLKRPDAASITNAGRFYLQVGNNEVFVLGQSGWAGKQYTASDTVKKKYDRSVSFIDDVGGVIKSLDDVGEVKVSSDLGDELSNILKYICSLADKIDVRAENLWMEAIPKDIYVDDLISKYNKELTGIHAILGEYDAPSKQYQDLLTLKLDEDGNTLIYGNTGFNREMLLSSIVYSLCMRYSAEDINIYIADFGSESLRLFDNFPQVGDIVYVSEMDKLNKLFNIVNDEILFRKKEFLDYNGEYKNYLKNSGKKMPLKIIVLNNYDSFKENCPTIEDFLIKTSRDGERYGVIFIVAATNYTSIYSKIKRNFHKVFAMDMKDRSDYIDIFGKIGGIFPAEYDGRGIFKDDIAYEFQTSQIADPDNLVSFVKKKIEEAKGKFKGSAPNIPVLPETITLDMLDKEIRDIKKLPIGMYKKNLKIASYDFFEDKTTIVSSKDVVNCVDFLKTVIYGVRKFNQMVVLIDTEQVLSSIGGMVNTYVDKNFEEFILQFEKFLDEKIEGKNIRLLCIIAGLEKFQGSMNEKKFNGFFHGIKMFDNVNLIFVDSSYKLKKVSFEKWYTSVTNNSNGIWIGSGFVEQNVFNCSGIGPAHREKIDKQFAWIIKNNEATLAKIVGEKEKDEE